MANKEQREMALKAKELLVCLTSHITDTGEVQACRICYRKNLCAKIWRLSQE